jgi:hypothetical protein
VVFPQTQWTWSLLQFYVDVVKDRIIWTNGSFPAAMHDSTIFWGGTKKSGKDNWNPLSLYHEMPPEKRLVRDSGYCGESNKISTTLGGHSAETTKIC